MEKKGLTPLQLALIIFIITFVLASFILLPVSALFASINMDIQFNLVAALICGAFAWVIATVCNQRAYIAALREQIDLLTDQANLLAEHINALESTDSATAETSSTPEKD